MRVEKRLKLPSDLRVLALVPARKIYTGSLDQKKFSAISRMCELAYREASDGHVWDALTLNGLVYASVIGEDPKPALMALEAGALGAGLSGKGPAVAAVVEEDQLGKVRKAWEKLAGQQILTSPNFAKAVIEE